MKAPDKIYYKILDNGYQFVNFDFDREGICYIRKDALLEWLQKEHDRLMEGFSREYFGLSERDTAIAYREVIKKLNSL